MAARESKPTKPHWYIKQCLEGIKNGYEGKEAQDQDSDHKSI